MVFTVRSCSEVVWRLEYSPEYSPEKLCLSFGSWMSGVQHDSRGPAKRGNRKAEGHWRSLLMRSVQKKVPG